MSIAWQILPYVLLTFGEVLVSATGAGVRLQPGAARDEGRDHGFWYLSVTFGNLWVLLANASVRNRRRSRTIAGTGLSETAFLMFFFAGFRVPGRAGVRLVRAALSDAGQLPERHGLTGRQAPDRALDRRLGRVQAFTDTSRTKAGNG